MIGIQKSQRALSSNIVVSRELAPHISTTNKESTGDELYRATDILIASWKNYIPKKSANQRKLCKKTFCILYLKLQKLVMVHSNCSQLCDFTLPKRQFQRKIASSSSIQLLILQWFSNAKNRCSTRNWFEYYYIRNMKQSYVYILAPDKTAIPV
jgi:hypothetical protein